jgi:2-dehydro-3-deoxyphosphogluconate aldolase/(4S)-4-hydroxy-2-oxoglutarate aldolase
MRTRAVVTGMLQDLGLIAVVRARKAEQVIPLSEALVAGGVRAVEITMTTPDALSAIRRAVAHFGSRALIGVGTVLDEATCRGALDAGAEFVVTPVLRPAFVPIVHEADRPIMLGAYTPTEAQVAHEAGADFIKIFPAENLGPAYIKAIRAPLPHLRIVPTGGVDLNNIADFFKAGCVALGAGGSLVSSKILERDDWTELKAKAEAFSSAVKAARK